MNFPLAIPQPHRNPLASTVLVSRFPQLNDRQRSGTLDYITTNLKSLHCIRISPEPFPILGLLASVLYWRLPAVNAPSTSASQNLRPSLGREVDPFPDHCEQKWCRNLDRTSSILYLAYLRPQQIVEHSEVGTCAVQNNCRKSSLTATGRYQNGHSSYRAGHAGEEADTGDRLHLAYNGGWLAGQDRRKSL